MNELTGLFYDNLKMNGKEIRDNRAKQIAMGGEMAYESKVKTLYFDFVSKIMNQESSLDMSPDNTFSFIKVEDFKPDVFADKDVSLTLEIRNAAIKVLSAMKRYEKLFGKKYNIDDVERARLEEYAKEF